MMPDYELVAIGETARDFAERLVGPAAKKFDTQPLAGIPFEILSQAEAIGLTLVTAPEEWGGGANLNAAGLIVEELAAVCPGFATIVAASLWSLAPLVLASDKVKAKRLFDTLLTHSAGRKTAALVSPDSGRHPTVTARQDGGVYVLNGSASFVFNAGTASLYIAFVQSAEGLVCCAIPASSPGLRISEPVRKLGLHVTSCADLSFEGVRLDGEYVLAEPKNADSLLASTDAQRHGLLAAAAVGCARAALHATTEYAQTRRQGGQIIARHDSVAAILSDMRVGFETSRVFVQHSLASPQNILLAILARIHATEVACSAAISAVQVFGGYGYMRDLPVEKLMRDSQQLAMIGGSNAWLRIYANNLLQGGPQQSDK